MKAAVGYQNTRTSFPVFWLVFPRIKFEYFIVTRIKFRLGQERGKNKIEAPSPLFRQICMFVRMDGIVAGSYSYVCSEIINIVRMCLPCFVQPRVIKVLNLWQKNGTFSTEVIQPLHQLAPQGG